LQQNRRATQRDNLEYPVRPSLPIDPSVPAIKYPQILRHLVPAIKYRLVQLLLVRAIKLRLIQRHLGLVVKEKRRPVLRLSDQTIEQLLVLRLLVPSLGTTTRTMHLLANFF
jgi:hypothetical protein